MRRLLAIGCCAVYLAFGITAGAAHVHDAADHHEEMRGLHLDHAHVGETARHTPRDHHQPASAGDGEEHLGTRHSDHHEGDALYLTVTVQRSVDPGPRVVSATVAVAATIDPPTNTVVRQSECPNQMRGPPREGPTPPRAPPT